MYTTRFSAARRPPPQRGLVAQHRPAAANRDTGPDLFGTGILPEQVFPSQTSRCPERPETILMRAVLADAFVCVQHGFVNEERCTRRLAQEAEAWFLSDDASWPFSFLSICAVLGLEPGHIRREVKQWGAEWTTPSTRGNPLAVSERGGKWRLSREVTYGNSIPVDRKVFFVTQACRRPKREV